MTEPVNCSWCLHPLVNGECHRALCSRPGVAAPEVVTVRMQRQALAARWVRDVFGEDNLMSRRERASRFCEEALELVHALQVPQDRVLGLVARVYGRPTGSAQHEIGDVGLTLLALCHALGMDADAEECAAVIRARAWDSTAIRTRHAAKVAVGLAEAAALDDRKLPPPEAMNGYADQFGGEDYPTFTASAPTPVLRTLEEILVMPAAPPEAAPDAEFVRMCGFCCGPVQPNGTPCPSSGDGSHACQYETDDAAIDRLRAELWDARKQSEADLRRVNTLANQGHAATERAEKIRAELDAERQGRTEAMDAARELATARERIAELERAVADSITKQRATHAQLVEVEAMLAAKSRKGWGE